MKKIAIFCFTAIVSVVLAPDYLLAQKDEEKLPIAVLPFVAPKGAVVANDGHVSSVQEAVTKEFSTKSRFVVLDRSKFETIVKELNIQKSEEFLNSQIVAQGRALGAKYLVAGVVNELKAVKGERKVPKDILKPFGDKTTVTYYQSSLRVAISVIDVETQQLIYNEPINESSKNYLDGDEITSITNVIKDMQSDVNAKIRTLFPVVMKIVAIEKTDKNGLPDQVLINGGGSMFSGQDARNLRLEVVVSESVGGFNRQKKVGELKVVRVEGELVVCDVKDGAKEISEKFAAKATLAVKPKS